MRFNSLFAMIAVAFGVLVGFSQPASAAFVLSNDHGGDGSVTLNAGGFDLIGADNGVGANTTSYLETVAASGNFGFNYTYTTNDCCGSEFDPAGYEVNGVLTQLSPASSVAGYTQSGFIALALNAGDTFGFYVSSTDSIQGRADIAVSNLSAVPLPASLQMFVAGLLLVAAFVQFSKRKNNFAA